MTTRLKGQKGNRMIMLIYFFCFCPLGLTIKLDFNTLKVTYIIGDTTTVNKFRTRVIGSKSIK